MPAKIATKTANIVATLYEGAFSLDFECVGAMVCKFALCSEMPVNGTEECFYRSCGTCIFPEARETSLKILIKKLNRIMEA